ncbi:hypothetical protein MY11210_003444 [Beauveria gryllotalpidicola]
MGRLIHDNDPELEWVVQKYGGTSIGKYAFQGNAATESGCSGVLGTEYNVQSGGHHDTDRLISLGEKLSCLSLLAILQDLGVEAEYVDLSTILPRGPLAVRAGDAYAELSTVIAARLRACGSRVPVITGFFGHNSCGMLASEIGRGYTDLCAALCAVGLGAAELQIWKEVDGILTADPLRVARAQLIPHMSLAEAAALTQHGSEVVHALAIRHMTAAPTAIALSIRNVKHPLALGTIVRRVDDKRESYTDSDTDCASLKFGATFCRAITAKDDACILHWTGSSCFPKKSTFPRKSAAVQLITTNTSRLSPSPSAKRSSRFSLSSAKRLFLGQKKLASSQTASIITLICNRADGTCRLASQVLAILKAASIDSTLMPLGEYI